MMENEVKMSFWGLLPNAGQHKNANLSHFDIDVIMF